MISPRTLFLLPRFRRGFAALLVAAAAGSMLAWPAPASAGPPGTASAGNEGASAGTLPPPDVAQRTAARLPGIDVSKWQGDIDWQKVRADGIRFVIARATYGNAVTDEKYAAFRRHAPAAGLRFTAYHYAVPSGRRRDAQKEASHFLQVANLHKGNITPALDLENSGGLSPRRLAAWVSDWMRRVRARVGTAPMIYTSPSFWRDQVGDTNSFAHTGVPLWIAHWGVRHPSIPAGNWAGRGWTFWQHTDCGSVRGISGCVDLDRLAAGRFKRVTIH